MASKMDQKMKECMSPHVLMHAVTGLGLGLVLASLVPSLGGQNGMWLGVLLIVGSIVADYMRK